ncbi:MAG: ferritin-like domain-containing protein [Pseudomonadota bacterium]
MDTAVARKPTLLDQPEARFPLALDVQVRKIRDLFPRRDSQPVGSAHRHRLVGARRGWCSTTSIATARGFIGAGRAWSEYGAISESPALLIRFLPGAARTPTCATSSRFGPRKNRAHAEACYLMAEKLGGYIPQPVLADYQKNVVTHGVRKMALDPEVPLEAIIAALVCAAEEIAFDVFRHLVEITPHPVANQVLRSVMRDEVRHCAFGWAYLEHRVPQMSRAELEVVEHAVIVMMEQVELNGYHSAWLAPDSPASGVENEADRLTWEAGLGATVEELEKPIFIDSVQRIRRQLAGLGINMPMFNHPQDRRAVLMALAALTLLDQPEQRFPLDLGVRIPRIRDLFKAATRNQWDPITDIAWAELQPERYTDAQRDARGCSGAGAPGANMARCRRARRC